MDSRSPGEDGSSQEALEFVRYCYRRRRAGWPELYDEMCLVASRGFYHGWGLAELAERGIGFSLFETPRLACLVAQVSKEEGERRPRSLAAAITRGVGGQESDTRLIERPVDRTPTAKPDVPARLVPAAAGVR